MENFAARVGLTSRGIVYILMGYLAFLIAGGSHAEADQKGALEQILIRPGGKALVVLMAIGFACYALWRFFEAATGVTGEKRGMGYRLISVVRGIIYSSFAFTAISVYRGSHRRQSTQQKGYAIDVMSRPGGRLVVGLLGLVIVAVGIVGLNEGWKYKFMRYFQGEQISSGVRVWIRRLGRIGITARGFVFVIVGILLVVAAWTHNAKSATGLDGALKALRNQPFGGFLLVVVATGLVIFGIYGLAEARYRRV